MTIDPDRDYHIAAAIAAGRSLIDVAAEHDLQPARIRVIAKQHAWMLSARAGRPVPPGLSIRAAISINIAISLWPTEEDAPQVAVRRREILINGVGRRFVMEEIDLWLGSLTKRGLPAADPPT